MRRLLAKQISPIKGAPAQCRRTLGSRIYARTDGRVVGAEMAAPAAEHMAHLSALAIGQSLSVHDLLRMPFYHPTLEEGLRTALRQIARESHRAASRT